MASTRFRTTKRAGAVALALAAGSTGVMAATSGSASAAGLNWDKVAQCESGGNWSTNTGNGFSGGLQFTPSTWSAYGGSGSPSSASRSEQIAVANRVLAAQGPGAWPVCSRGASGGTYNATESSSHASRSTTRQAVTRHAVTQQAAPSTTSTQHATTTKHAYSAPAQQVYLSRKLERQDRADVLAWQKKLNKVSHFHVREDGHFGAETEAATKALQKRNHKLVDGIVGPQTRSVYAG